MVLTEDTLSDQLLNLTLPRLRRLSVTGRALTTLEPEALKALRRSRELVVELTGTQVQDIPVGFFAGFSRATHLSVDLRGNRLQSLSPTSLYSNATAWEQVGTKLVAGKSTSTLNIQAHPLLLVKPQNIDKIIDLIS